MSAFLAYSLLLAGLILGATRPGWGLGALVAVVVVTPTLPWQLGLVNLAYPLAYILGYLLGIGASGSRELRAGKTRDHGLDAAAWLARALVLVVTFSCLRALFKTVPFDSPVAGSELLAALAAFASFNPDRSGGLLQAAAITVAGLLLFMAARILSRRASVRRRIEKALLVGVGLVLVAPILQIALLDPTVRPDKGLSESVGFVAWFQDPHSHAAYLVLVTGALLGLATASAHGTGIRAATFLLIPATAFALSLTSSRSGLLGWLVCVGSFLVGLWASTAAEHRGDFDRRRRWRQLAWSGGALAIAVVVVLSASATARGIVYGPLEDAGYGRMFEFLDPEGPEHPLLGRRLLLWDKAESLIAVHPLWGAGPQGFIDTRYEFPPELLEAYERAHGAEELVLTMSELPTENAHNYYLQFAAEFGLPGLALFVALIVVVFVKIVARWRQIPVGDRRVVMGMLAGISGFLSMCLLSHPLLLPELQALFFVLVGYALAAGEVHPARG